MQKCSEKIEGYRCIYVEDHGGDHFAPQDGRDHSDDIRIRVLLDRIADLEFRNASLREALRPFADECERLWMEEGKKAEIQIDWLTAAREALALS